ncbi:hypothetical protein HPB52_025144 [Rhipicephalus sanguineus]|uniref:CCHC-type domain-containing protein n=1 Tax=Rhipicephalus sanguineus TaxID=34632 RepID=A0A9D4YRM9_RHISA|nr:hypothetical protein HPB52_025144 [Rhipicephalus sanguineus]
MKSLILEATHEVAGLQGELRATSETMNTGRKRSMGEVVRKLIPGDLDSRALTTDECGRFIGPLPTSTALVLVRAASAACPWIIARAPVPSTLIYQDGTSATVRTPHPTGRNERTKPTGSATTRGPPPSLHLAPGNTAPPASQTVDEEGFQTVRSRAALRRTRDLTTAALPVDSTVVGTVLYHPAVAGGSFRSCPRLTLAQALLSRPGVAAIRVNHHRNVVAADATSQDCLEQLLTLTELQGIPVTARQPADRRTCTGFLHGVDGDPDDESLLSGLQSAVWVLSATREGRTLTLRFEGPVPSDQVTLHRVRFPVPPARPRPLECRQCGRYGHVKETCNWPGSCIRCGQTHPEETDCQRLRCVNCSGPHRTDTPDCPRWQEQRRVATIMASSTTALSRRAVAALVREETREARSYSSAVKGHPAPLCLDLGLPRSSSQLRPYLRVQSVLLGSSLLQRPPRRPQRSLLCYQQTTRFAPSVCRQGHGNRPPTIMASPPTRPPCSRCGDPETLEHLLCTCPGLAKERSTVTTAYWRQGLPAATMEHLLFPSCPLPPALRSLAQFLEETGIAAYH